MGLQELAVVVASAEGLGHDVAQGGLGQVAILLLGGPPLSWWRPAPPPGPAWVAILPGAAQAPRARAAAPTGDSGLT